LVISDIGQVLRLFELIQNIHLHGIIGDNVPKEWVNQEDVHRAMPSPKLRKNEIRDFLDYQAELGNLEKNDKKGDFDVRQSKAEYKVSRLGHATISAYNSPEFQNVKNLIKWRRPEKKPKDENDVDENEKEYDDTND